MGMSQTVTRETLTAIIRAAGLSPRDFDVKATLTNIADWYNDEDNEGELDMETITEWLDETGTKGNTYQLCPWLA
jgi:hypothetical protein